MMEAVPERELLAPPTTYEDWLLCFDFLKSSPSVDDGVAMTIAKGSFVNRGYIAVQFHQKLADTINEMLNKRIARFLKDLNMLISFNELSDIVPLFVKLRNEVEKCLFFRELEFLDKGIKHELEQSIKTQMGKFWNDTVTSLQKQTLEFSNDDLEDSLLLIRRIRLFAEAV
jgi:hypothetical protein